MEYTPYGELWVEHGPQGLEAVPYRFTGKELDQETGLYYYGARYLNPRTSRWISADPAMESYLPVAPINEEAKKHNQNLPGLGGTFNPSNLAAYCYAGNNPPKYADPSGQILEDVPVSLKQEQAKQDTKLGESSYSVQGFGCVLTAYTRIAMAISGKEISLEKANAVAAKMGLYDKEGSLSTEAGAKLIGALTGLEIGYKQIKGSADEMVEALQVYDASKEAYYTTGRIWTQNQSGTKKYGHSVSISEAAINIRIGLTFTINGPQPIVDTSETGRASTGWSAGRPNALLRADVFYIKNPSRLLR